MLVYDVPLYKWAGIICSIVEGNLGCFQCLTVWNSAGRDIFVCIFWVCLCWVWNCQIISLVFSTLLDSAKLFPKVVGIIYIPTNSIWEFMLFLSCFINMFLKCFIKFLAIKWYLILFNFHFPNYKLYQTCLHMFIGYLWFLFC